MRSQVVAVPLDAAETPLGFDGGNLDLSRDGTRLAVQRMELATRAPDIWVHDLKRGSRTRVTFDGNPDIGPVWSPDGSQLAYVTQMTGYFAINIRSSSGAGTAVEVARTPHGLEITDWSRDAVTWRQNSSSRAQAEMSRSST